MTRYHYKDFFLVIDIYRKNKIISKNIRKIVSEDTVLFLSGYVLDTDMSFVGDKNVLKALCRSKSILMKYNGTFCGIFLHANEIIIFSDRMTTYKVYFALYENRLYVSNNPDLIARICPAMPEIDEASWAEMLFRGNLSQNHTLYKGISTLGIGEAAIITQPVDRIRYNSYDTVFAKGEIDKRPVQEIVKDIVNSLYDCIYNAYQYHKKSFAATITGGRDSRLLVGISKNLKISMPLITVDTCLPIDEYDVLRPVLDYMKLTTYKYPYMEGYYERYAEESWRNAGFMTSMHIWFAPAMQDKIHLRRWYMTGLAVDHLINDGNFGLSKVIQNYPMKLDEVVDGIMLSARDLAPLLSSDFLERMAFLYRERTQEAIAPFTHSPRGIKDFYIQTRGVNDVLLISQMFKDKFASFSPFLCNTVLDKCLVLDNTYLGANFYALLFEIVDKNLYAIPSTRSKEQISYAPERKIDYKPILNWAYEKLRSGPMLANHYVDNNKFEAYFNFLRIKNRPLSSITATVLGLDFWLRSFSSLCIGNKRS